MSIAFANDTMGDKKMSPDDKPASHHVAVPIYLHKALAICMTFVRTGKFDRPPPYHGRRGGTLQEIVEIALRSVVHAELCVRLKPP